MVKRLFLIGMLSALAAGAVWAGDVAQFVNLGFSDDSRYFMFSQFGVLEKNSAPYAELYVVDVPANAFTSQGIRKVTYTKSIEPGNSGQGALFNLIEDALGLKKQFRIDHLLTGRLLYLLVDGGKATDTIEFRDFLTSNTYTVNLMQNVTQKGTEVTSTFHIALSIKGKGDSTRSLDIGSPNLSRSGVKGYHVKMIVLAPDGKSLVFVIQKEEQDTRGVNIRYMVETVRIN
jgi:predicted secreted protein